MHIHIYIYTYILIRRPSHYIQVSVNSSFVCEIASRFEGYSARKGIMFRKTARS